MSRVAEPRLWRFRRVYDAETEGAVSGQLYALVLRADEGDVRQVRLQRLPRQQKQLHDVRGVPDFLLG